MSDFNKIISSIIVNDEVRKSFFENPDKMLANYNLSEKEIAEFKAINFKELEEETKELDERISKSFVRFWDLNGIWDNFAAYHSAYAVPEPHNSHANHSSSW